MSTTTKLIVLLLVCLSLNLAQAQQPAPAYQKAYLHLDRPYYSPGDDIWFKAYLVDAVRNRLTADDNNLYVELIDNDSKIVRRELIRLENGTGHGDFHLSDSLVTGTWRIRAYTNWMLNFGQAFVFERKIEVINPDVPSKPVSSQKITSVLPDLQFFPEGGALVEGVESNIAFKAVDSNGKGIAVAGKITDSEGKKVCDFQTQHSGMGRFSLLPEKGKAYFAAGSASGATFSVPLPQALALGVSMMASQTSDSIKLNINLNDAAFEEFEGDDFTVEAKAYGKICASPAIEIRKKANTLSVAKNLFPAGIVRLTVYDKKHRPHCERLVYIERPSRIKLSIQTDRSEYHVKDSISLIVKTCDLRGNPIKASLSLAAVDAGQTPVSPSNIFSYLNLESELKGNIENPSAYFDTTNLNRQQQLDLLLLTQGWSDYLWRHLEDSVYTISHNHETGINITGKVLKRLTDTPVVNSRITMTLMGAKQNGGIKTMTTDSLGRFAFEDAEFYGKKRLILNSKDEKNKAWGRLLLDSLYSQPLKIKLLKSLRNDSLLSSFEVYTSQSLNFKKYKLTDTIPLNEVVVKKLKGNTYAEELAARAMVYGGNYVDQGYKDQVFIIGSEDYNYQDCDIFLTGKSSWYLQTKGLPEFALPYFYIINSQRPHEVNDKIENVLFALSMDQIEKIVVRRLHKLEKPEDIMDTNDLYMPKDYIVIEITTKPGALDKPTFHAVNTRVEGYYLARTFYTPKHNVLHQADLRTTLYWNPEVITNEKGEAKIKFYNTDKTTSVRITAEGMITRGGPLTGATSYSVK